MEQDLEHLAVDLIWQPLISVIDAKLLHIYIYIYTHICTYMYTLCSHLHKHVEQDLAHPAVELIWQPLIGIIDATLLHIHIFIYICIICTHVYIYIHMCIYKNPWSKTLSIWLIGIIDEQLLHIHICIYIWTLYMYIYIYTCIYIHSYVHIQKSIEQDLEHLTIERILQPFVGIIDAKLLERIALEKFKPKNIWYSFAKVTSMFFLFRKFGSS